MTSYDFRRIARQKLQGRWMSAIAICIISWLLTYFGTSFYESMTIGKTVTALLSGDYRRFFSFAGPYTFSWVLALVSFFVCGAILCGRAKFFLNASAGSPETSIENILSHTGIAGKAFIVHLILSVVRSLLFLLALSPFGVLGGLAFYIVKIRINQGTMSAVSGGIILAAASLGAVILAGFLIVPAVRFALGVKMTPFILSEHPELSSTEAIRLSLKMMKGNIIRLLSLYISFSGWYVLCLFTCFLPLIFLVPYICMAEAEFFNEISGNNYSRFLEHQANTNRIYGYGSIM